MMEIHFVMNWYWAIGIVIALSVIYLIFYNSPPIRDACPICKGKRGGVPGNENIINGLVVCDYCDAKEEITL